MTKGKAAMLREYRRELRKVLNRIEKLQSEGYVIPSKYIPKHKSEKYITKREIERLKKYKETYIKNMRGTKYRTREGKMVSGAKGEEIQRSEASKKGWRERRWREEVNRTATIQLGEALLDAINREIDEGIGQITMIRDASRREGYWQRCLLMRTTLNEALMDNREGLLLRLGRENETVAVERTQIACRYDRGATEDEAWGACTEMLQILRGRRFTLRELAQMEEGDTVDWFDL